MFTSLALALLSLSLAPPRTVEVSPRADDALRILVVAADAADTARVEEIYAGLRAAGLLPAELDERAGVDRPVPPAREPGQLDDARAALQEALLRFRELDLDGARAAADSTVDEILRLERPELATEVLSDALLLRARLALQAGAEEEARGALLLVVRLEPAREALHPGIHPPSLVEAYAAARAAEREAPTCSMLVLPRVARFGVAELLIDGQPAKLGMSALRAGPHLVTLRAPGFSPESRVVLLASDAPVVVAPFLGPAGVADARATQAAAATAAAAAQNEVELRRALEEISALSAAGAVLLVTEEHVTLFVRGRGIRPLAVPPSASGSALGRATLSALQSATRQTDDDAPGESIAWSPLLVAGVAAVSVAAVALGVGAGAYFLTPPTPPELPPSPVVVSCCVD